MWHVQCVLRLFHSHIIWWNLKWIWILLIIFMRFLRIKFGVLGAVTEDITPCSLVEVQWRFGGTQCPPTSGSNRKPSKQACACCVRLCRLLGLLFSPGDGGSTLLCNVGKLLPDCMASHPRRWYFLSLCTFTAWTHFIFRLVTDTLSKFEFVSKLRLTASA
jgi:hypothetical protein